ncbi:SRPBCC family protein [Saccharopolyspora sp. CA-218241]|uniref:SRPBCC family protein n=1 Tax=Saccharopolyspora sp. CA-218241 TaxID=3240027 RepID=UPI003D982FAC
MARSYASAVVDAPVEQVWELVRDFDGLPRWHPAIERSEIEGGGPADRIGAVRRLALSGGGEVRERLVALDDTARSTSYEFVTSPFPVRRYRATLRVAEDTAGGRSFVEWCADYDADAADEAELDRTFATGVFAAGLAGLQSHVTE